MAEDNHIENEFQTVLQKIKERRIDFSKKIKTINTSSFAKGMTAKGYIYLLMGVGIIMLLSYRVPEYEADTNDIEQYYLEDEDIVSAKNAYNSRKSNELNTKIEACLNNKQLIQNSYLRDFWNNSSQASERYYMDSKSNMWEISPIRSSKDCSFIQQYSVLKIGRSKTHYGNCLKYVEITLSNQNNELAKYTSIDCPFSESPEPQKEVLFVRTKEPKNSLKSKENFILWKNEVMIDIDSSIQYLKNEAKKLK